VDETAREGSSLLLRRALYSRSEVAEACKRAKWCRRRDRGCRGAGRSREIMFKLEESTFQWNWD
jgi:hypothetical protein